jgi:hypothetical protein
VVVDTSVWIDYFNGYPSWQAERLIKAISDNEEIILPGIIQTEILLGFSNDKQANKVANILSAFDPPKDLKNDDYQQAAKIYRTCRKNGKTIRSTIDCLIAAMCLRENLELLSKDRDFDVIAQYFPLINVTQ